MQGHCASNLYGFAQTTFICPVAFSPDAQKVVQLKPLFKNVPWATFRMHLFSSVLSEVPVCKGTYLRGVFST